MKIAFFDFDGTITNRDSLIEFIKFSVGNVKFIKGIIMLLPMLILYKLKVISNHKSKQIMLSYFFKGMNENEFVELTKNYSLNHIDKILRDKAIKRIKEHKSQGDKVVIVSASIECWLKPWCEKHDLELIATKLEVKNNKLTGKFATKNCHGMEKVVRIEKNYNLKDYNYIYAYGDSSGDKAMLKIADEQNYKPFIT